jgi:hypothetical protein
VWTNENRGRYERSGLRYPSDLTNEEWALVEPLIPPARRGGAKRTVDVREVANGLICAEHRLPVAGDPQGPTTALDDLRLFRSVELGRHAGSHPRRALRAPSRGGLARGEPDRRHHRQPERQERGKRGRASIRPATTRARKSRARSGTSSSIRKAY